MKIRKNDNVIVISGKDKGKTGTVVTAFPRENRVIVAGVNMRKRHEKTRRQDQKGKIVEKEAPISVSNVMLLVNNKPTRLNKARGSAKAK
ncbi:MAG TPA: 50S ribosomal protein L24 [Candidatus Paceibacterota bacterium]|jgi:large subunit ribosomal protein L24|nr:50S ribosomal protein L24 [Candidatus Paceibacterota bacterium]